MGTVSQQQHNRKHRDTAQQLETLSHCMSNTIVQKGVFDAREYKKTDVEWARRRKSEYLGPGKFYYTREITRPADYKYDMPRQKDGDEDKADQPQQPPQTVEVPIHRAASPAKDIWPRRVKSDLTKLYH